MTSLIFHVDVNSAYLSWNAIWEKEQGLTRDLRQIPSAVGGDPKSRRGIVLAKSPSAKACGVQTGESLYTALKKCPGLLIVPPQRDIYRRESAALVEILLRYSPILERASIDECYLDMGSLTKKQAVALAQTISADVRTSRGFTVNIGIGENKLCAKMASDFEKPNRIHTLFPDEIKKKLHPLPVSRLLMVGPVLSRELHNINIQTVGDLAACDASFLRQRFGKMGDLLYRYARGLDDAPVVVEGTMDAKGMSHSMTLPEDVQDPQKAHRVLDTLLLPLHRRLLCEAFLTGCVNVHYTTSAFVSGSHQKMLPHPTDSWEELHRIAHTLLTQAWRGVPLRKIGVCFSHLTTNEVQQLGLSDWQASLKKDRAQLTVETLKKRFGKEIITQGDSFPSIRRQ
ncbi:DNA polymerase IV [Clostridiaceae bacterium JG1575]|nr:DNA polymerase IV [Clostridiaceae bacterium JG1575]